MPSFDLCYNDDNELCVLRGYQNVVMLQALDSLSKTLLREMMCETKLFTSKEVVAITSKQQLIKSIERSMIRVPEFTNQYVLG